MRGEPQPGDGRDKLERAIFALKTIWFGLFAGGVTITVTMIAIVFSNDSPMADLGALGYLFLLAVPVGLLGAYVVAPMVAPKDPAAVVQSASTKANPMYDGWAESKPDEAYYWFPAYVPGFFLRAGMLEGTAIICAMGFVVTANWLVLGGALLLIAALVTQVPTRSAVEAFAANARQRRANAG